MSLKTNLIVQKYIFLSSGMSVWFEVKAKEGGGENDEKGSEGEEEAGEVGEAGEELLKALAGRREEGKSLAELTSASHLQGLASRFHLHNTAVVALLLLKPGVPDAGVGKGISLHNSSQKAFLLFLLQKLLFSS